MRTTLSVTALGLAAVLLSGCGGDGDEKGGGETPSLAATAQESQQVAEPAGSKGLAGTWKPINKSPIAELTITGNTVRTTGRLACPGTITGAGTPKPVLTLKCATENADRKRGTLKLKPDGSALVVTWDGPSYGGVIDSLKRSG
ncbi:hypothetical protein [Actinomadura xylanilytica]|uniref:hypothetical protein n=1 Tax=Actinomadura xylanilytica TaxID=887459 RepID=UPI00255ABC35|nr:hypothetical protein [Actinomadura xylanilytica]MDL4776732.1 hypothetical protein [Actinomadura xylanilytica]